VDAALVWRLDDADIRLSVGLRLVGVDVAPASHNFIITLQMQSGTYNTYSIGECPSKNTFPTLHS